MEKAGAAIVRTIASVENGPLVKFIRNYIRDSSDVFSIILTSEDIVDVISRFYIVVCAKTVLSI